MPLSLVEETQWDLSTITLLSQTRKNTKKKSHQLIRVNLLNLKPVMEDKRHQKVGIQMSYLPEQ